MYPTIPFNVSGHFRPSGHFDRMQPATRLPGTLTHFQKDFALKSGLYPLICCECRIIYKSQKDR